MHIPSTPTVRGINMFLLTKSLSPVFVVVPALGAVECHDLEVHTIHPSTDSVVAISAMAENSAISMSPKFSLPDMLV